MQIIYTPHHRLHDPTGLQVSSIPYTTEELPERVEILLQAVSEARLGSVQPPRDFGLEPILAVHLPEMVDFLQTAFSDQEARFHRRTPIFPEASPIRPIRYLSRNPVGRAGQFALGPDSPILAGTWQAAYWSAQCALTGAARLIGGRRAVYALCRPPGHHAAADIYGGFCYLNNAAVAARYLQDHGGSRRVAILDIDYHHGNGTQEIFYRDPSVLFCSLHAHPDDDYPYYWGGPEETGQGPGEGFNCNYPLQPRTGDDDYLNVLAEALDCISDYAPDHLIVSLGLDTALGDPVGGFAITQKGFEKVGAAVARLNRPTLIVQEGGYLLETLGENAVSFLESFLEEV